MVVRARLRVMVALLLRQRYVAWRIKQGTAAAKARTGGALRANFNVPACVRQAAYPAGITVRRNLLRWHSPQQAYAAVKHKVARA